MSSIVFALHDAGAIVIMPRRASLAERRSGYQATARTAFADRDGIRLACEEADVVAARGRALKQVDEIGSSLRPYAEPAPRELIRP
jgi:hypothetical protein